jgi:hypothetical protein
MRLSESELSAKLGAPTQSVKLSDGTVTWTYRDNAGGLSGGECTVSVNIKDGRVVRAFVNKTDLSPLSFPLGSCRNILGYLD